MEAFVALGSALAFSTAQIMVRLGLRHASARSAISISITFTTLWVWISLLPFASFDAAPLAGVSLFMFLGAMSPLVTQALLFGSALHVGISRASPLRNMAPLFASLLSIGFLGERWTLNLATGTILIITGATLLGMRDADSPQAFDRRYLSFPLLAALVGGISSPLRKFGFSLIPSVPLATCILMLGSILLLLAYLTVTGSYKKLVFNRNTFFWFGLAGLASGAAVTMNLAALHLGTVVVVAPLVGTTPLFTVIQSMIFLRSYEHVTLNVALGATAICLGGILLILLRT